jgi:glycosyltransferase involved in cell wall biosynthesis
MRILYVSHDFLPHVVAGTELSTFFLAKEIAKRREVRMFFNIDDEQGPGRMTVGVYDGLSFSAVSNPLEKYNDYAPLRRMDSVVDAFESVLREFQPQIVHFNHILHLAPQLVRITHEHGLPIIFTLRDFWLLCHQIGMSKANGMLCDKNGRIKCGLCRMDNLSNKTERWLKLSDLRNGARQTYWRLRPELREARYYFDGRFSECREIFDLVDLFICHSVFVREMFIKHGLSARKIICTPMGMPALRRHKKQPADELQFGFMGGERHTKGLEILLKAFDGVPNAKLQVFGKVSEEKKAAVKQSHDVSNICFHGTVTGDAKEQALSQVDVFIIPSLFFETFSRVTQEAYQLGAPVIASNIGALPEYVRDGVTGLLFEAGNPDDLQKKIRYFVDNPSRVAEMGSRLPEVKSIEEHAAETEGIYVDLIDRNRGQAELMREASKNFVTVE